jgi:hypothetical protein
MTTPSDLPLADWQTFYVVIGSSGAALTGLTFIVITITAEANAQRDPMARLNGLRAFITPTVVHFVSALWLSAVMTVPRQTADSLAVCLALSGLAGVGYCARVTYYLRATTAAYKPFVSDWVWNVILPLLAYLCIAMLGLLLRDFPVVTLYLVGGLTLLLLFIGLHNAWDVVVWATVERHTRKDRQRDRESN